MMLSLNELLHSIESNTTLSTDNIEFDYKSRKCKLAFIGDIHGSRESYLELTSQAQYSLQVGDMYNSSGVHHLVSERSPKKHKYISGNHDWFAEDFIQPKHNLGDYGVWSTSKLDIGYIRGANSIDKTRRLGNLYDPWHEEEELSYVELQKAIDTIGILRPSVMVTHMAPTCVHPHLRLLSGVGIVSSRTMDALEALFQFHQPKLWCMGHYHQNMVCTINGTVFVCINMNEMMPII